MKKNQPKITVVIPYCNSEKNLERAVRSILDQTFTDFQLILINNNSADKSPDIAWVLSAEDSRISLLTEKRIGMSYALNLGTKNAKGMYIAYLDANDYSLPSRLEKQINFLESNPDFDVVSCLINYESENKSTSTKKFCDWTNTVTTNEELFINRFVDLPLLTSTLMLRKNILEEYGYFLHGDFPEIYELFLRWMSIGLKIEKIQEVLVNWVNDPSKLIHSLKKYRPAAYFTIKSVFLAQWLNDNEHPYVWIWGAGHLSRKRVEFLENAGIFIEGYIDVVNREFEDGFCIHFNDFNWEAESFVISYVGNHIARNKVREFLISKGKTEGKDFILAS